MCIWRYILQNYNYKLHFQNLSTYHIPHVSIETLAAENLDVCTTCDSWDSNMQLTMVKDQRPGPGMPFLDSDTCAEGGGGYLFMPGFSSVYDAIHWWMTGRMDGKSFTTTMSFTICNFKTVQIPRKEWKETEGDFMHNSIVLQKSQTIYVKLGQVLRIHTTRPGAMHPHNWTRCYVSTLVSLPLC